MTVLWLCEENNVDTSMVEVDGDLKNGIKIMADISQQERAVSSRQDVPFRVPAIDDIVPLWAYF